MERERERERGVKRVEPLGAALLDDAFSFGVSHRKAAVTLTVVLLHTVMPVFSTFIPAIHSTKEKEKGRLQNSFKAAIWGDVCVLLSCNFRIFYIFL